MSAASGADPVPPSLLESKRSNNQSPNAPLIRVQMLNKSESKCSTNQSPNAPQIRVQSLNKSESECSTNQSPNAHKSESECSTNQSPNAPQIRVHNWSPMALHFRTHCPPLMEPKAPIFSGPKGSPRIVR